MIELSVNDKNIANIRIGDNIASDLVFDLKRVLDEILERSINKINIDMTDVHYINSSGLAIFVGTQSRLKEKNGFVKLYNVSQELYDFFEGMNLAKIFEMEMAS